jgi:hypothetical protein
VLLCTHHHRLLHEGGYSITADGSGTLGFRGPRGERIPDVPPSPELVCRGDEAVAAWNRSAGLDIDPNTAYPAWDGWPMDYEAAVDATLSGLTPRTRDASPDQGAAARVSSSCNLSWANCRR